MSTDQFITFSPEQTMGLGKKLAQEILKSRPKSGAPKECPQHPTGQAVVIALSGELGSGKTTFLKGFARGLGVEERILSPTFVILKRFGYFYHIDCYRIKGPKEILDLGLREIITDSKNIVAIEWSERIKKILPSNTLLIKFELMAGKESQRRITISPLKSS